jgi:hypothetical protein
VVGYAVNVGSQKRCIVDTPCCSGPGVRFTLFKLYQSIMLDEPIENRLGTNTLGGGTDTLEMEISAFGECG